MWPYTNKQKHEFDLDHPIIGGTGIYKKKDDGLFEEITATGFKCRKCNKILWLDRWQVEALPNAMSYCE